MKKLFSFLLWTLIFALLLVGADQFFSRVEPQGRTWTEVRSFYLDFRQRLLNLPQSVDTPRQAPSPAAVTADQAPPEVKAKARYLYVDGNGDLQFADGLEEVPLQFRKDAQKLEE